MTTTPPAHDAPPAAARSAWERLRGWRLPWRAFLLGFALFLLWPLRRFALGWSTDPFRGNELANDWTWAVFTWLVSPFGMLGGLLLVALLFFHPRLWWALLGVATGSVLGFVFGVVLLGHLQPRLNAKFIRDTRLFVVAVETYVAEHGRPPDHVEQLVPDHLQRLPHLPPLRVTDTSRDNWRLEWTISNDFFGASVLILCAAQQRSQPSENGRWRTERIGPWQIESYPH